MVPESKILGQSSLIFITIGSTNFQFNRLFAALDKTLAHLKTRSLVIVQGGNSDYRWRYKNIKTFKYLSPSQLIKLIKKSDKIIAHAGPATLYLLTKYSKDMPFIVPRLKKFSEHIDDHQLVFAKFIKNRLPRTLRKYFFIDDRLEKLLSEYLTASPRENTLNRLIFINKSRQLMIKKISQAIEN